MMVGVAIDDQNHEGRAVQVPRALGASDLERAEGMIENGDWSDFDPVAPLSLLEPQQPDARLARVTVRPGSPPNPY